MREFWVAALRDTLLPRLLSVEALRDSDSNLRVSVAADFTAIWH